MKKKSQHNITLFIKAVKRHNGAITIAAVVVLIISIFLFADRGFLHFYNSYDEQEKLKQDIKELENKKELLLEEKDKLQNDPQHIEKIAREKYKMKKKDEKVYQIEKDKEK